MNILIILAGLVSRSRSNLPSESLFKNIINPNNDGNTFDVVMSTSHQYYTTGKWCTPWECRDNKSELNDYIQKEFNKNGQLKELCFHDMDKDTIQNWYKRAFFRLYHTFKEINIDDYDMIIFSRPDIKINKPIDLKKFINGFYVVMGDFIRPENFHNRDWDYLWIGNASAFKIWTYLHISHAFGDKIENDLIDWSNDYKDVSTEELNQLKLKVGLIEDPTKVPVIFTHYVIYHLLKKGYDFRISDNDKIFANIIR